MEMCQTHADWICSWVGGHRQQVSVLVSMGDGGLVRSDQDRQSYRW